MIYRTLRWGQPYVDEGVEEYEEREKHASRTSSAGTEMPAGTLKRAPRRRQAKPPVPPKMCQLRTLRDTAVELGYQLVP